MDLSERIDYFGKIQHTANYNLKTKELVYNELTNVLDTFVNELTDHYIRAISFTCDRNSTYKCVKQFSDEIYNFLYDLAEDATQNSIIQTIAQLVWKNYDIAKQSDEQIDWETVDDLKVIWIDAIKDFLLSDINKW